MDQETGPEGREALEDGWLDGTPDDDSLVRQGFLNLIDRAEHFTRSMGATWEVTEDLFRSDFGFGTPFANAAMPRRPIRADADADRITSALLERFGATPFLVWCPWPVPDLSSWGLQLMGHPPFMVRPPGPRTGRTDAEELVVEEVADDVALEEFERTMVEAFPIPGLRPGEHFLDGRVLGGATRFFVGRVGGEVVGTASAQVSRGVAQVELVSVRPEHRGRGYGESLTWAATLVDPALPAVLLASDDGQPIYERMGYLRVARWTLWGRF